MTSYQRILAKIEQTLDPLHMESLAYAIGSTLNGMPHEFFKEVAALAKRMGPARLEQVHNGQLAA